MKLYVLGLIFSYDRSTVLLQRKTHPAWQRGHLNGIGGHVEDGETTTAAIVREAREETKLYDVSSDAEWEHFATIGDPGVFDMACFRTFVPDLTRIVAQPGEEPVFEHAVSRLSGKVLIGNLYWLIPFALDDYVRIPQWFNERTRARPEAAHA